MWTYKEGQYVYWNGTLQADTLISSLGLFEQVGIGTNNPDKELDIIGDLKIGEKAGGSQANYLIMNRLLNTDSLNFNFNEADTTKAGIGIRGNTNGLSFSIGTLILGNIKMYLDTNGYIGMGTVTPTRKLEVFSSGASFAIVTSLAAAAGEFSGYGIRLYADVAGGIKYGITAKRADTYGRGDMSFLINNTASAVDCDYTDEKFRIARTGDVQFCSGATSTPTLVLSGALFVSGGQLWYKGFSSTYTKLANA